MAIHQTQVIEKLIKLSKQNDDIACIWLYGSRARGTEHVKSDYDLAVLFKTFVSNTLDRRLRPELLAIDWNQEVDAELSIIDIDNVPLTLSIVVLLDDKPLYVADYGAKLMIENKLMSRWEHDGERYRA